jgi:DNA (cytosine-5)-methyltransferase 1
MKKIINFGSVFSGIGAPEQALKKLEIKTNILFACDNGEIELSQSTEEIKEMIKSLNDDEINSFIKNLYSKTGKKNYMKKSYMSNYKVSEDNWFDDIRFLNGGKYKRKVDILTGGSPCQSFSIIGKRAGLEDTRGTLFYEFARLVNQCEPRVFIYENVPGMLTHDKSNTWKVIRSVFDSLGYKLYFQILNAIDYGIPQDRKRLFIVGFKDHSVDFKFPEPIKLSTQMSDYLEPFVDPKHYLGKKGFEFVTNPKYRNRARVNPTIIQTQKANQQFNWNGDFVFEPIKKVKDNSAIMSRAYVSKWNNTLGVIRQLSYRECLRLMGFPDSFKIVVPNVPAYRQAGNSIVVNLLESIFKEIFKVVNFYEKD